MEEIEKHTKVIQFATFENQETRRVNQIVLRAQHHSNHIIAGVVRDKVPTTLAELRICMASLPYDSLHSALPAGTF